MQEHIIQIIGYLHGMWRYRWSGLFISWIVALMGWVAVLALPNQYEAKAVIYIDTESVLKPLLKGLAVETDAAEDLAVINRILLSRENLLSVIRETDMDLTINNSVEREMLIRRLAKKINLHGGGRNRGKNVFEISYEEESAQRVYQVVSILLNTMIEKLLKSSRTDTAVAQKFLNDQIKEYEERLRLAEKKLAEFKKKNIGMMPDEKGGYYARLQAAQNKADLLITEVRLAKQRSAELHKQLRAENPTLNSANAYSETNTKLRAYQAQLKTLLARYTENHPDVIVLQQTIRDLQKKEPEVDTQSDQKSDFNPVFQDLKIEATRADVEVEALKLQLSDQQRRVEELKGLIDAIPEVEAKLAELNRDYNVTHQRYLELVDRRESARMADLAGQSSSEVTVRVIEAPVVPVIPSGPKRNLFLLAVLFVAFGAGMGWCVFRYLLNPTVINVRQMSQIFELPVFGSVSLNLTTSHIVKRSLQLATFLSGAFLLAMFMGGTIWLSEPGSEMVREFFQHNSMADVFDRIKTMTSGNN